ncbi:Lrp/AsnC family transcriptional regulator [Providencia hangzhouensis]
MAIDKTEIKILKLLQDDARITNQVLAEKVGMSASPCWRRVKKLEEENIIQGYRAILNRKKIGLGVMVFVRVIIDSDSEAEAQKFEQEVTELENVVACYSIGGDTDFLLQVVSHVLDSYADFAMTVIRRLPVINSKVLLYTKEIKPLDIPNITYLAFKLNKILLNYYES